MELDEIMRLINQGLLNQPMDAPERDESFQALGALESRMDYSTPGYVIEIMPDGFTRMKIKEELKQGTPSPSATGGTDSRNGRDGLH